MTIDEIYLQGEGGRTTLRSDPVTVDLCDLGNQALMLVQDVQVPAGSYQEIRFVISGGYVQERPTGRCTRPMDTSCPPACPRRMATLQMPSWGSSGLKVEFDHGPVTIGGEQKVIALDLDLAQSFGEARRRIVAMGDEPGHHAGGHLVHRQPAGAARAGQRRHAAERSRARR